MNIDLADGLASPNCIIGADMPLDSSRYPIRELLDAFRGASEQYRDLRLVLAGRRERSDRFVVWNYLDTHGLTDKVEYLPSYGVCREFPVKKQDCAVWIDRDTPAAVLTPGWILSRLRRDEAPRAKLALFITSFHPGKHEGNSALMRQYLEHLRAAGYRVHILYYALDKASVTDAARQAARHLADMFVEVDVSTQLVGCNSNGLNVHPDDWCGGELLDAVERLSSEFEYDVAVVNYAFLSATFERVAAYTRKILVAHDSFADRNRRLLEQGFPESGWLSLDRRGEAVAFGRADVVVALQDGEAELFRALAPPAVDVRVVGPVPAVPRAWMPQPANKLRIGYVGSHNWVNEYNLVAFLTEWAKDPQLVEKTELVLAGGLCASLVRFMPAELTKVVSPRLLGEIGSLHALFEQCDVFINPERGGTGIKIKTLDAMAHGAAVLTTAAGAVGIGSRSRFHAAPDVAALAHLVAECVANPTMVQEVRRETRATYEAYAARHSDALTGLFGPARRAPRRRLANQTVLVPDYVRRTASSYHFEEFERVFSRLDLRGKRVLELGSDFHLASARLFAANGAAEVVANNLWEWRSQEPLPANVRFCSGDFSTVDLPEHSFDIVYGIAILEHIPDVEAIALAVRRMLKPGGLAYLQGCPVWTGALGHHLYLDASQLEAKSTPWEEGRSRAGVVYSFTEEAKNPIPHWAHLNRTPTGLRDLLIERGTPAEDAKQIVNYVYNLDGRMTGACSNFKRPSEIIREFQKYFEVDCKQIYYAEPENPEFKRALEIYSEADVSTLGLQLWLTAPGVAAGAEAANPIVSIVIPFYNVEAYLEDCLRSVLDQDLDDFEVILVDDQSPDGSRAIAERFAAKDDRLRIVAHAANAGLGPARNSGVRHARGEYVLFLDSDDVLAGRGALGRLVDMARRTGSRVVIGSCERLKVDGTLADFDRQFDREHNGQPGTILRGLDAFFGGFALPGRPYLPLRAWGTLIERKYYERLGLDYPAGEHEDMPHVPFLYLDADGVFYDPAIAVLYRERPQSLSSSEWPAPKFRRYADLWRLMKARMTERGLYDQIGDVAAAFSAHLMWRVEQCGARPDAADAAAEALGTILGDLTTATTRPLLFSILRGMTQQPWNALRDADRYALFVRGMPAWALMDFHRDRLGRPQPSRELSPAGDPAPSGAPATVSAAAASAPPAAPRDTALTAFETNAATEARIIAEYEAEASPRLKTFPSMLTLGDKAVYFHAGRNFGFRGAIVDGGCFVGGTTTALVEGLRKNPIAQAGKSDLRGLIRVYDLFAIDDDYILQHLRDNYPHRNFETKTSFLPIFEENMRASLPMLQVRPGDVTANGYPDPEPIEVLGVDFCKAPFITDFMVREFFPRVLPGGLVLQQDFVHEFHPHIHLSMLRLADHFETYVELKWGGTVAYRCVKPVTRELVRERFGADGGWYADTATNVPLLRRLIDECHHDENRWVFLLTLAIYHSSQGRGDLARQAMDEALTRFPHFVPSDTTRRIVGAEAS
jgi:glycosyltransferase involved in cell wall biosynthesis/SAM-dependent methyltransferase